MNLITLENISKNYVVKKETISILNDINLIIEEKDFLAILGNSGCGKSTLLNILAQLDTATTGKIEFNPQLFINKMYNFGLVQQKPIFLKELNIRENILLPIAYNKQINQKKAIEKMNILAKKINIHQILEQKVTSLSGGEKQRVSIIRSLVEEPKILFLDEPTGALDEENGSILIEMLNQLKEELNITLVMVTHNTNNLVHCNKKMMIKNKTLMAYK